jgi:hypothetical protein
MKSSNELKYPDMRRELFDAVSVLSGTPHWFAGFDFAIHIIFDDLALVDKPIEAIGSVLVSQHESTQILLVAKQIDALLSQYGKELSDAEYQSKKEWRSVELESLKMWKLMVSNTPDLLDRNTDRVDRTSR